MIKRAKISIRPPVIEIPSEELGRLYRTYLYLPRPPQGDALMTAKWLFAPFRTAYYPELFNAVFELDGDGLPPFVNYNDFIQSGGNPFCIYEGWAFKHPTEQRIVSTIWELFVDYLLEQQILKNRLMDSVFSLNWIDYE